MRSSLSRQDQRQPDCEAESRVRHGQAPEKRGRITGGLKRFAREYPQGWINLGPDSFRQQSVVRTIMEDRKDGRSRTGKQRHAHLRLMAQPGLQITEENKLLEARLHGQEIEPSRQPGGFDNLAASPADRSRTNNEERNVRSNLRGEFDERLLS